MLTQYNRKITMHELGNATIIPWIMILYIIDRKNTYRDTKCSNHKTYRIKKLKLSEIHTRNHRKPIHRLD